MIRLEQASTQAPRRRRRQGRRSRAAVGIALPSAVSKIRRHCVGVQFIDENRGKTGFFQAQRQTPATGEQINERMIDGRHLMISCL